MTPDQNTHASTHTHSEGGRTGGECVAWGEKSRRDAEKKKTRARRKMAAASRKSKEKEKKEEEGK